MATGMETRFGPDSRPPATSHRDIFWFIPSHALMRQLTLECGYSSARSVKGSISVRVKGMAGILIYTSTSDSDGTLGGLQRQGTPGRIERADPCCNKGYGMVFLRPTLHS